MFKCTVCNAEYKIKPDYCECGNDTFSEIAEQNIEYVQKNKKDFPVKKLLSIFIFLLCILLSVVILSIKQKQNQPQTKKVEKQQITNIPDIEKIWNSTPPKEKISPSQNIITVYEKPLQKQPETKKQAADTIKKHIKPKKVQQPAQNKLVSKPAPQQVKKTTSAQNKPSSPQTSKPVPKPQQPQQPPQQPKQQPAQPVKQISQPAPQPIKTMNSQEWDNYKNSLRYALLSKLDIVKISGEGDCAIEFSLDNSGKLLNRRFIYKSQNKTVNDEVYLMLMKLPVYKTPPAYYNGEKIKMKFYINNGYYEISFL